MYCFDRKTDKRQKWFTLKSLKSEHFWYNGLSFSGDIQNLKAEDNHIFENA